MAATCRGGGFLLPVIDIGLRDPGYREMKGDMLIDF